MVIPGLVPPYGGELKDRLVEADRARTLVAGARAWPSWYLTARQLSDLELLLSGGFSPLEGFLGRRDYESVCADMRLANGLLWPIPIVLAVSPEAASAAGGGPLALRDPEGKLLAVLFVEEAWTPDLRVECAQVVGTTDPAHPGVGLVLADEGRVLVAGHLEGLALPTHHDSPRLRHTPRSLREELVRAGVRAVVAFQTRNPLHRAHFELTHRAARAAKAHLLVHPAVGTTAPGDVDGPTRVRCYQAVMARYPPGAATLSLLPLAMRMAGPREALWHAIVRRNHGCSHLIVGRDHAGPGRRPDGRPYYDPYAAQELVIRHEAELGVRAVPFQNLVYLPGCNAYVPEDEVPAGAPVRTLSGTELRRRLAAGEALPEWFTFPEVAAILGRRFPPPERRGLVLFLTGLPSSGKSTLANGLAARLEERGRPVTLLDGDVVRRHLSAELGFSREHRDLNIRRIAFVAAEIARHGGVTVCAAIAPYDAARRAARAAVQDGTFVLVHVRTSLEVCEQRDAKGLYAKARAGRLPRFTGVSDPYEPPEDAEVVVDAGELSPDQGADRVLSYLDGRGLLPADAYSPSAGRGAESASLKL